MKLSKKTFSSLFVVAILITSLFMTTKVRAATAPILTVGSRGDQVVQLQKDLKTLGYFNYGSITGYYGSITQDSVIKFQRANNLYVDGIAGERTISKVKQLTDSISSSLYTVKSGDSLWTISLKYGTTVDNLKSVNSLVADIITVGQILKTSGLPQVSVPVSTSITESQNPNLYWLSRIVEAEASGEPYQGKVAIGNVILNRVSSPDFPGTVKGVIFEYYKGIPQFSPVADGTIYNSPSQDSIKAAQDALNGSRPVSSSTYFFNPDKSAAVWIVSNKTYIIRIGNHVFYR